MSSLPFKNTIKLTAIVFCTFFFAGFICAEEQSAAGARVKTKDKSSPKENKTGLTLQEQANLTELQKTARLYRQQGIGMQRAGNLDGAMSFYQKAIELDPYYAVIYNDLGVIYETKGEASRAEESYLKSIQLDPAYLSAYSNLALFYEHKRDLKKAAYYWGKRAQLGLPDDPWTQKAQQRLDDIRLVLGEKVDARREIQVMDLVRKTSDEKSLLRKDDKALARSHLDKARQYYKRNQNVLALREAINAKQLDSENVEINEFIEKVEKRLLSR